MATAEENISVSVRVRPLSERESDETFAWSSDGASIWPISRPTSRFSVDRVFGPAATTNEIYETDIRPLIESVVVGINATFFAYGQTSSGKTYTIQGVESDEGVVRLAVHDVFELIRRCDTREFLCRASYLEIYNEEINDLLCDENTRLPLHETKDGEVCVGGLTEEIVEQPESVMQLLLEGEEKRHTGATKMNERSSRSHTIFRMIVESRALKQDSEERDDAVWVSTLNLVDLAGSERISKTGAEGLRMKEGTAINKSLLNLGIVINQLAHKSSAVSYRDSKLTRILQRSLGGNAKTAILCNITPAGCHVEESSNTLRFGCRAKEVINTAHVNEVLSDEALLKRQAKEIEQLKKRLAESGNPDIEFEITQMRAALLRSEHEKELMQIKLDEEKAKKEKAERQVQVATQLMFSQEQELMLLQDRHKRRDTWCPGELSQSSAPRLPGRSEAKAVSKELDFATPPSAKRHRKTRASSNWTGEGVETETAEVMRMSTEDVRQLVRDLVEEKAELQKRLNAALEGENQRTAHVQSLEVDLKAAYRLSKPSEELGGIEKERDILCVKLATMKLRNQELTMENQIATGFLKKCLEKQKTERAVTSPVELQKLQDRIQELMKSEVALKEDLKGRECTIEALQGQVESQKGDFQLQSGALRDAEEQLKSIQHQHSVQIDVYEKELHSLRVHLEEVEHQVAAKHEELSITKKSKSKSENQERHLSKERDLHSREVDRLKKRLEDQETKTKGLQRERLDLQSDKSTLQRQIKTLERENGALKNEALKKDTVTDKKRDALQQELNKAKERQEEMKSQHEALQSALSKLELQIQTHKNEYEGMKGRLASSEQSLNQQRHQFEQESTHLQSALNEKAFEAEALRNQLESLTVVHSESLLQLESTREQLSRANKAVERLETRLLVRTAELQEEAEFRIHELTVQLELTTAENVELRKYLDKKEDAYLQLEISLQQMEDEKQTLEQSMKAQHDQHQLESEELSEKLQRVQAAQSEADQQMKHQESVMETLRDEISSLNETLKGEKVKNEELSKQSNDLREQLQRAVAEMESQSATANEETAQLTAVHQQEIQKLCVRCEAQVQELNRLKAEMQQLASSKTEGDAAGAVEMKKAEMELQRLRNQLNDVSHQLGATQQEAAEWKKMANTTRNVEDWVQSLSSFIYELKFQSNQLLADFDQEENHIPTKLKTETRSEERVNELTERLRSAKRTEMELYGVLKVMREDIKKAGWQPEKLDELLENSRKEYRRVYTEGKLQRLQTELQESKMAVVKLERELREMKKQIPPKKLEIDLNKPPPSSLN